MQKTYEDIMKMNINSSKNANASIDDEHKFTLFQNIADALFVSFDHSMQSISILNFQTIMSAILRWVEESCRPPDIHEIIRRSVSNFRP